MVREILLALNPKPIKLVSPSKIYVQEYEGGKEKDKACKNKKQKTGECGWFTRGATQHQREPIDYVKSWLSLDVGFRLGVVQRRAARLEKKL